MGFDVRFQLVDQRAIARVLAALAADHSAPPPSAFDRLPDAALRWDALRAAWKCGRDADAAAAACAFLVSFSGVNLPALLLRNFALTHRPLRMADELSALEVPLGSPRRLFEYLPGVRQGLLAALPERIDHPSRTGTFLSDPVRAGQAVSAFLSSRPLAPEIRRPAARLLALFRAAERSGLAVWEAQDDGAPLLAEHFPETIALFWPGLARAVRDDEPLSVEEWESLDGSWLRTHGDLVDLLAMVELVDPLDARRVPAVRRALSRAFAAARASSVYVDDDVLPRALTWVERTLVLPELGGEGVLTYHALEASFLNRFTPRVLPAAAFLRATEIATPDQLDALLRSAELRPHDTSAQAALAQVLIRLSASAGQCSIDKQETDLFRLLGAHRKGSIPAAAARAIAERWYTLASMAPERIEHVDGDERQDNTPCVLLLARVLQDPPSPASARMLWRVFQFAEPRESDERTMAASRTLAPFSLALLDCLPAVRAFLARAQAPDDAEEIEERILAIERRARQVRLRGLFEAHATGPIPAERAREIAQLWCEVYFDDRDDLPPRQLEDDSPAGYVIDLLFGPSAPAARSPVHLASALLYTFDIAPAEPARAALEAALRRHQAAVRALASHPELGLSTQLRLQDELACVRDVDFTGPPSARAEAVVRGWWSLSRPQHPLLNEMVRAGHGRHLTAAFTRWLADSHGAPAELSSLTMRLTGALNNAGLTDPDALDACHEVAALAFARQPNPNFLYNAACGYMRRGDIERAAHTLAQAIALDPTQADDARGDSDFVPHLDHPALAALLRR